MISFFDKLYQINLAHNITSLIGANLPENQLNTLRKHHCHSLERSVIMIVMCGRLRT